MWFSFDCRSADGNETQQWMCGRSRVEGRKNRQKTMKYRGDESSSGRKAGRSRQLCLNSRFQLFRNSFGGIWVKDETCELWREFWCSCRNPETRSDPPDDWWMHWDVAVGGSVVDFLFFQPTHSAAGGLGPVAEGNHNSCLSRGNITRRRSTGSIPVEFLLCTVIVTVIEESAATINTSPPPRTHTHLTWRKLFQ